MNELNSINKCLKESIAEVDTDVGRKRVHEYLDSLPFPHYRTANCRPGLLLRIEKDGTETIGGFVNREFRPAD